MFIAGTGMTTALGLSTEATCAAMRGKLNAFNEVPYRDVRGRPIVGAPVTAISSRQKGVERLFDLTLPALAECMEVSGATGHSTALLIGLSADLRSKRLARRPNAFIEELRERTGVAWADGSRVLPEGPSFIALALSIARGLLEQGRVTHCLVGAVDSFLDSQTLQALELSRRLKKEGNPDGLVPGEAACFIAWTNDAPFVRSPALRIAGTGSADVTSAQNELPGSALAAAMQAAFTEARAANGDVNWEITDLTGERDLSVEHAIAVTRVFTDPQPRLHCWHQAMGLGAIGAAAVPCSIAWAAVAIGRGYAPGPRVLCIGASDPIRKCALVIEAVPGGLQRG